MTLTKCDLITDVVERREYDRLAALCSEAIESMGPSHREAVRQIVWRQWDAYQRLAAMEVPPPTLFIDPSIRPWSAIREKCAAAAAAYEEMHQQFGIRLSQLREQG